MSDEDELIASTSVEMKQALREKIQKDVEAFLAAGGHVTVVPCTLWARNREWSEQHSAIARARRQEAA